MRTRSEAERVEKKLVSSAKYHIFKELRAGLIISIYIVITNRKVYKDVHSIIKYERTTYEIRI